MDLLDRLNYLLRSVLEEPDVSRYYRGSQGSDPDWREAWKELDEYMKWGFEPDSDGPGGGTPGAHGTRSGRTSPASIPSELRKDFETLEAKPGAPITEVRRQFRRELSRYHPDHFIHDPEKFKAATAVTRELIRAYRRIRDYYGTGKT